MHYGQCYTFFSVFTNVKTNFRNMENKRTQEEWRRLHENAIIAILNGKCANPLIMSMSSIIDQALWGADDLIKRLKEREEKQ